MKFVSVITYSEGELFRDINVSGELVQETAASPKKGTFHAAPATKVDMAWKFGNVYERLKTRC